MSTRSRGSFPALRKLASLYGVQTGYTDIFGHRRVASPEPLLAILGALGAPIHRPDDVPSALRERRSSLLQSGLEPVVVAWDGRLGEILIRLETKHARGPARFRIISETGEEFQWDARLEDFATDRTISVEGKSYLSKSVPIGKKLGFGYHRLQVQRRTGEHESLLISAPQRAYETSEQAWGVFVPLYALQSRSSWGAGDFSDLDRLQEWAGGLGAKAVATLPFLAAFLEEPMDVSPYAPASRLFWNELYVDPRKAAEFQACPAAQTLVNSSEWQREVRALQEARLVDYARLMALKRPVLEAMARWLVESKSERHAAFVNYVRSNPRLADYAAYRAVLSRRREPWREWPQALRDGRVSEADYSASDRLYHLYVQWVAEEQVQALRAKDVEGGGFYLDFPLGVHPHSYDVWRYHDIFALEVSAGAPPDTLFLKGQNWSFPPLHPEAIRRQGYAYLIACFQHQFRYASWFRVDHVMGLHRLFWIPPGMEAKDGVYVRYRPEEMYAILSLESHRSKTVLVGENLGTVPAAVNRAMERHGLRQMFVLQYEARPNQKRPLRAVPANAVASLNTHDMPPFAGFFASGDIDDLARLGVFDDREERGQRLLRQKVCRALGDFFRVNGAKRSGARMSKLARECLQWLGRSKAKMVLVNLEDLWLETAPQNMPGTSKERDNWQRKARYRLEEFTGRPSIVNTLRSLHALRSSFASKSRRK